MGSRNRSKRSRQLWVFATAIVLVTTAAPARAQTNEAAPENLVPAEATTLFEAGMVAFRDGRPADAQDLFRRSLEIHPTAAAAWNLTLALRATNDLVDAVQIARQLLNERHGPVAEEQRAQIEALLDELLRRVAVLDISTNHSSEVAIAVDGTRVGVVERGQQLEHVTDAGEHLVSGIAPDAQATEQNVVARAGARTHVTLTLQVSTEPVVVERRTRRWWIWVVAAVCVVGVATGLTVGLLLREEPQMVTNPLWGERGYIEALTAGNER